jgi:2',3'-cyclic-nucleotide 2'-phosphodiesterase (5'-nucleotidase family)
MSGREIETEFPLAGSKLRLRLLAITELHANIYPYDYYRDCPDDSVGLARAASLVRQARGETPNCLLFDNGDILQGAPLGDFAAQAATLAGRLLEAARRDGVSGAKIKNFSGP